MADLRRDTVIKRIKTALEERSGKKWSVRHGTGTASGWIFITASPKRRDEYGRLSPADQEELKRLLGLEDVGPQWVRVPDQGDSYQEFVDRAEGREPRIKGVPRWD
jgi:hypothetical protein